jgi:hypothetical protein
MGRDRDRGEGTRFHKRRQQSRVAAPPRTLGAASSEPDARRASGISLKLPIAYLHILGTEAKRVGLKRGHFLQLLLQRKRGEITLERAKDGGETYDDFTQDELITTKMWIWYVTPRLRKLIDEDRIQMGLTTIGSWITQMLNQWIGRPEGLRRAPRA